MKWALAALLAFVSVKAHALSDTDCLAYVVAREATGEPIRGRRAVLDVILNRMHLRGKNACSIISEPSQFSWYRGKKHIKVTIEMLLDFFLVDSLDPVLENSVQYFVSKRLKPYWTKRMKKVATIGNHSFYSQGSLE